MKIRYVKKAKKQGRIFVFCMVYNEEWFLPHFLDHHRRLGVDHFVFYDDLSTDRTREMLLAQDDCTVVMPTAEPGEKIQHGVWLQKRVGTEVPELEGPGKWGITLDADELMILPTRFSTIGEVVGYLDRKNLKCALAPMVDFYPQRLADRFYDPLPPIKGCPWFDRDPGFQRIPGRRGPQMIPSGVRVRLLRLLASQHPEKMKEIYGDKAYRYAKLWKVPIVKTGEGIVRTTAHNLNIEPPTDIQLAIAHFKFYPRMDERIDEAFGRNGHFQGGVEYKFLKAVLELFPEQPLVGSRSVEYLSPEDLERAGLMWAH